jgi:hypothetical protein
MVDLDLVERRLQQYFTFWGGYGILPDGTVNVKGTCALRESAVKDPLDGFPVKFGTIKGSFIATNVQLISLKNAPREVTLEFHVSDNPLGSLEGSPDVVGGDFFAMNCDLDKLDCARTHVKRDFIVTNNLLTNLEGCPKVDRHIDLRWNDNLESLRGWDFPCEKMILKYNESLPLVRCLQASEGLAFGPVFTSNNANEKKLLDILNNETWRGKGKLGAIPCAAALIKAGYAGNAKW